MTNKILTIALVALTAFAMGALASSAAAAPFTPELEADYAAALAWWGVASPPQCATVRREIVLGHPDGAETMADATQPDPGEVGVECVLNFFGIPSYVSDQSCVTEMVIRHEVGHLTGHGHSQDPTNVMYPTGNFAVSCPGYSADVPAPVEAATWREPADTAAAWRVTGRLEAAERGLRKVSKHCRGRQQWRSRARRRHCLGGLRYWRAEVRRARDAIRSIETQEAT